MLHIKGNLLTCLLTYLLIRLITYHFAVLIKTNILMGYLLIYDDW